jgi:hypothetical protein
MSSHWECPLCLETLTDAVETSWYPSSSSRHLHLFQPAQPCTPPMPLLAMAAADTPSAVRPSTVHPPPPPPPSNAPATCSNGYPLTHIRLSCMGLQPGAFCACGRPTGSSDPFAAPSTGATSPCSSPATPSYASIHHFPSFSPPSFGVGGLTCPMALSASGS